MSTRNETATIRPEQTVAQPGRGGPLGLPGLALLAVGLLCLAAPAGLGQPTEWRGITADAPDNTDEFGRGVAIEGDSLLVGAPLDDDKAPDAGAVYVYRRDGREWVFEQKLLASDGAGGDWFGKRVALSGNWIIAGALYKDGPGDDSGGVYFFEYADNGTGTWEWIERTSFNGDAAGNYLGTRVSIKGDLAVAGSPGGDDLGQDSGHAYVYQRKPLVGWQTIKRLVASGGSAGDQFGFGVAITETFVAVGADQYASDPQGPGAVYVYRIGGDWQEWKLTASDGAAGDRFGGVVSVEGTRLLAGAWRDDDLGTDSGSAYVFEFDGTDWNEVQKITASDGAASDYFGYPVVLHGNMALIGADIDDNGAGAAYLFRLCDAWTQDLKLVASDRQNDTVLGYSVALDDDFAVIGAPWWNGSRTDQGKVYLYPTPEITLIAEPTPVNAGVDDITIQCLYDHFDDTRDPLAIFVTNVDGTPLFTHILTTYFESDWRYTLTTSTPPWLAGHAVTLQALKLALCGGLASSNEEEIIFQ